MNYLKYILFLTCFALSLNIGADEKEKKIVTLPDTSICLNGNNITSVGGFTMPIGGEHSLLISLPASSDLHDVNQNTVASEYTNRSPIANDVLPTYTMTVTSEGDHGYVSCSNTQVRNGTQSFTAEEGSNYTITATPDEGYRVKYIRYQQTGYIGNKTDYTDTQTTSHSQTLYNIKTDVTFTVEFEKIPDVLPTYTMTVTSEGDHGYVSCSNTQVRNGTQSFTAEEGSNYTITATPDEGYRVKYIRYQQTGYIGNKTDYTDTQTTSHSQTLYNIKTDVTFTVEFEKIYERTTMYTVTLESNGEHGTINHAGDLIRNTSKIYNIEEGSDFVFKVIPDEGYRVANIIRKMEGMDAETWNYSDNISTEHDFTSYSVSKNQAIEVNFGKIPGETDHNIYLSIIHEDNDTTKLQVEKGEKVKLQIKAVDNCRIQSVCYNGNDVTSQLVDGFYTTPAIYQSAVIRILYESGNTLNDSESEDDKDIIITTNQVGKSQY